MNFPRKHATRLLQLKGSLVFTRKTVATERHLQSSAAASWTLTSVGASQV
jgi:hypothetical protein